MKDLPTYLSIAATTAAVIIANKGLRSSVIALAGCLDDNSCL